jgi:hypothetical protein
MEAFRRSRVGAVLSPLVALAAVLAATCGCHGEPPAPPRDGVSDGAREPPATAAAPRAPAPPAGSAGQPPSPRADEYFTGRAMTVADAKKAAADIVVGETLDTGKANPDAPGQIFHDGARLRVTSTLAGKLSPGRELGFSYTRQVLPAADAEAAPVKGESFIFFLAAGRNGGYRAIKILRATPANLALLSP